MKINFNKNTFTLQSDGSLFWNKESTLILGDLHLEKSSYFAKIGNFLPPYDSLQTLKKLELKLMELKIEKIILLGDIFHDEHGIARLCYSALNLLNSICNSYKVIWIKGNHDGDLCPKNVIIKKNYSYKNIFFNHISDEKKEYEISGHYHPKVYFILRRRRISKPCFLVGKKKIILPAYGTFTGGLAIQDKGFKKKFSNNFSIYIMDKKKVFLIS